MERDSAIEALVGDAKGRHDEGPMIPDEKLKNERICRCDQLFGMRERSSMTTGLQLLYRTS